MNSSEADVVIIGSGFGGSISANRLASAGLKVLVLERGPWRDSLPVRSMGIARRAPFPYGMKAVTHLLRTVHFGGRRLTLNKSGLFEVFSYPGLRVLVVSAVGGGSHGWFGMLVEPQDPDYWKERHPDLNPSQVEKYYDKIVADMGGVRLCREHWLPALDMDTAARHGGRQMSPRRLAAPRRDQASLLRERGGASDRRGWGRPSPDVRV